jgi:Thiamine monophosphate synthase
VCVGHDRKLVPISVGHDRKLVPVEGMDHCGWCALRRAVYFTQTKDSPEMGLARLADICRSVSIPVVAIGGIGPSNAAPAVEAGAAGVAVVTAVFNAPQPSAAARCIREVRCGLGIRVLYARCAAAQCFVLHQALCRRAL